MASHKMNDILNKSSVAICKDLMCAQGIGENLELREVFVAFYDRHVNEDDPGTCILKITLTSAVAFSKDAKYVIGYASKTAAKSPFFNDIVS